ncbi:FAD-binding Berberine family protein [Striga asiatica]|uniref:FAD-binding Berberine family protein n=1 Tax=Striga asiatica TaxID=4170 RepID=A0A5A7NZU5_STRAF|nr:FAD-binding Berberine family protein [Striga asiatica]
MLASPSFPCHATPFNPTAYQSCVRWKTGNRADNSDFHYRYDPSFTSILNSTAQNLRCVRSSCPKPLLIFTPEDESQVQAAVACASWLGINLRTRSGGHDYEGLSYISLINEPFLILDLQKLRHVTVNPVDGTAWAQTGATTGEFYYQISQANRSLGFPAGICPSLGLGGHISGGAYGPLMRMYGLGATNVLDVRMVDSSGNILDKRSMGPDVFWAVRGGGGGSFGVVLAWKLQLVPVPEKVTVFTVAKTMGNGNGIDALHTWQTAAPTVDPRLFVRVVMSVQGGTVLNLYNGMFLGDKGSLECITRKSFPGLKLRLRDCKEMSWIEAVIYMAGFPPGTEPDVLMKGKPTFLNYFKAKSDFVNRPITKEGLAGLRDVLVKAHPGGEYMILNPLGGAVANMSEDELPFSHGKNDYLVQYVAYLNDGSLENQMKNEEWVRMVYNYMEPFVTSNPRESYVNFRDLDLGQDERCRGNCTCPYLWGESYFKGNFYRLVSAKYQVDPKNFFRFEQSIPPWHEVVEKKVCYDLITVCVR